MACRKWSVLWLILLAGVLLPAATSRGANFRTARSNSVGFPPGGTTDIIARDVGQESEKLGTTA